MSPPARERIAALDVLRGIAVAGIWRRLTYAGPL